MTEFNIASLLKDAAIKWPRRLAVIAPHRPDVLGRGQLTYQELDEASDTIAARLLSDGAIPGSRVIVLVKPGVDFVSIIFGLFKAALVPVMVDPGMGLFRMLRCLGEGRPSGIVGLTAAHILSLTAPRYFKSIKMRVTVGPRLGWGGRTLLEIFSGATSNNTSQIPVATKADDLAAILFTSGSTGPAKGVVYTHAMFRAQVEAIREGLDIREGGVDLATFPLFGLFAPALGLTSVIPNINAAKPGKANPLNLIDPIIQYGVTSMFASPTLVGNVASYAHENNVKLPSLRRVIMAGAPARPSLVKSFSSLLSAGASLKTPYGATEGMPLSTISGAEILDETSLASEEGLGMCVGHPLPGVELRVIAISDTPIAKLTGDLILPHGEIGEIIAKGPMVSPAYFERPRETAQAIIEESEGVFWRRMGDVGWLDTHGRLWFCGRKAHRVVTGRGTLFSIPCEAIFNKHPQVARAALVGVGKPGAQRPIIIIEPVTWRGLSWNTLCEELLALAKTNPRTLHINTFLKYRAFPVDVRHNAKISREKLALWAAQR